MTQIKLRRDTAANFTSKNPVLGVGEPAYETDTKKLKIGDGTTAYTQLEYFSAGGGGSTDITATLPLKIVDGVISLEVDGQTIQIVDGKLHANLDKLENEVNSLTGEVNSLTGDVSDLSGRVTAVEADVLEKQDKLTVIEPLSLASSTLELNHGMTITEDGTGFYSNTAVYPSNMERYGRFYTTYDSTETNGPTKFYIIPYKLGQIVKIPCKNSDVREEVFLANIDSDGNIDFISNTTSMINRDTFCFTNKGSTFSYDYSSNTGYTYQANSFVDGVGTSASLKEPVGVPPSTEYFQIYIKDNVLYAEAAVKRQNNYTYSRRSTLDNSEHINRLSQINAILITQGEGSTNITASSAMQFANYGVYSVLDSSGSPISLYDYTGDLGTLIESTENLWKPNKALKNNSLQLSIGPGLSVVDGKLTATGGSGLEVCDIGMALYVDETKGLRRYLNGQIVDINTNTQAFLNRLQQITTLHPSLLCTENEWQTAKTNSAFGQVGKFVFNYSGENIVSVRLPRVVNVQGLFDLQNLGMTVAESLPNIKGAFGINNSSKASGAFSNSNTINNNNTNASTYNNDNGYDFDASRSSSTYKDNAPVQQEAIQYPYFIQIATGSETENNIINDIELNNPYSLFDHKYSDHELNNLSWLKSEGQWNAKLVYPTAYDKLLKVQNGTETVAGLSVKLSTETYTDYDFVLNTTDETFRLPLKTKLASGKAVVGNGKATVFTIGSQDLGSDAGLHSSIPGAVSLNTGYRDNYLKLTTDSTKSGIELSDSGLYLYFYVGETVQNANLIDAGRIGEQLANKQDKLSRYPIEISDKSLMPSWYVVYNDGWCEQGGKSLGTGAITINLLKTFTNTNYTASASLIGTDGAYLARADATLSTFTPSSFKIDYKTTNPEGIGTAVGYFWQVSGYIR